ncbi:MAG: hypothetical protein ACR2MB_03160 [Acidimicrobiales bacterium]
MTSSGATTRRLPGPLEWFLRDRRTGGITIAQVPNISLATFLVAAVLRRVTHPTAAAGAAVTVVATGALMWWAGDEVVRGANPWRRSLGAVVLVGTIVGVIARRN